jgi:hypothetical protein
MLTYQRNVLKSRVNTVIGTLFLASWASAWGLMMWNASFETDPVESAFIAALKVKTDIEQY